MTMYASRACTSWALIAGFCGIGETGEDTDKMNRPVHPSFGRDEPVFLSFRYHS